MSRNRRQDGALRLELVTLPGETRSLRDRVRTLVDGYAAERPFEVKFSMGGAADREFSRVLADAGLVGLAIPQEYGGAGLSAVDRFVVNEELLMVGAPQRHHYVADRQSAPTILRFGTPEQRERFLPRICSGELSFSVALSEPDAGSDLASVRTTARKVPGGWLLTGTKVWTSGAHRNDYALILVRTDPDAEERREGMGQFILDLRSEGLTISPIPSMDGLRHFNEVVLADVFVPDENLLGEPGAGWRQVNSELSFERAGPDRLLTPFPMFSAFVRETGAASPEPATKRDVGRLMSRFWSLRLMSLGVSHAIEAGEAPAVQAAMVKDAGTRFEQDAVATLNRLSQIEGLKGRDDEFERLLNSARQAAPTFTLRGGATEILRGIVARRTPVPPAGAFISNGTELEDRLLDLLERESPIEQIREIESAHGGWNVTLWQRLDEAGLVRLALPESCGGEGGTVDQACAVLRSLGRVAAQAPVAESGLLAGTLLADLASTVPAGPMTLIDGGLQLTESAGRSILEGTATRVPWLDAAQHVVCVVPAGSTHRLVMVKPERLSIEMPEVAVGERRGTVRADGLVLDDGELGPVVPHDRLARLRRLTRLARLNLASGAIERIAELSVTHARERHQFGRPLSQFQAVQQQLAVLLEEAACSGMAARAASARPDDEFAVLAAHVQVARSGELVVKIAHQLHGAIGLATEYPLSWLSRRVEAWLDDAGGAPDSELLLGELVYDRGADQLRNLLTDH